MNIQVLIVGAGPTGLSLACFLTRLGIDFVIVDKKEALTTLSKAMVVQARTLEIYDQMGIAATAIERGEKMGRARVLSGGEIKAELNLTDIGQDLSPFPFALILEQSRNEEILFEYLQRNGHNVRWETGLEGFSQSEAGVEAVIKNAKGESETIQANYLVGCDGAGSFVRHHLGLTFEGTTIEEIFYVADVEMDFPFDRGALYPNLSGGSFVLFFAMKGDRKWRVIGNLPEYKDRDEKQVDFDELEEKIKRESKLALDITKVNWFSVYRIHSRMVGSFSSRRCFVAGDAAHIHTPAGGQGMNTGIQDAYNLAWKLALVLKGQANQKLLDTYNEERLPNAKRLLETTDRAFRALTSDSWAAAFVRTEVFPRVAPIALSFDSVKNLIFPFISQIGINYRESSLSKIDPEMNLKVKPGDRMPYIHVDGDNIYDFLKAPKFHVVIFSDGEQDYGYVCKQIEERFGNITDCHEFPIYPHVSELFGNEEDFLLILRPDNYIGNMSALCDIAPVQDYFEYISVGK